LVQLHKIGDFVMTTPLIRSLALAYPDRDLILAVSESSFNLAETCPYTSEVVQVATRLSWRRSLSNIRAVRRASLRVAAFHPSIAVDPRWTGDLVHEGLMVKWSGATTRLGFAEKASSSRALKSVGFDRLFTQTHPGQPGLHEARQMLLMLELLGVKESGQQTEVWLTTEDEAVAAQALGPLGRGRGWVAFAPGAGEPVRCWPSDRFAAVAAGLVAEGWRVVVIGGPEDGSAGAVIAAGAGADHAVNLVGRITLRQTAAVLAQCRLLVANDSAPAHLATAVGVPTLELSTHPVGAPPEHDNAPERWAPLGTVLQPVAQPGCEKGCVGDRPHCIMGIETSTALAAARHLLSADPNRLQSTQPASSPP
jgi:ADP-heptose:LPS heptosyltransferase